MRARAVTALFALAGCASPETFVGHDLGRRDGGGNVDLRGADLSGADLSIAIRDLAMNAGDLAGVDLASASDLASPADLARPPDLATSPDLAMACVAQTQPCDAICQNCGANMKCTINMNGNLQCQATGAAPVGGTCGLAGTDDCVAGAVCLLESQSQPLDICGLFCRSDVDCKNGGKCVWGLNGTNPPLMVCSDPLANCDPVKKTGCNAGACFLVTPDGQPGCHRAGNGAECVACTTDYDCQAGFACFASTAKCPNGGCAHLCHINNNADCANGETCQPVTYDQNGDTWANWGVCT